MVDLAPPASMGESFLEPDNSSEFNLEFKDYAPYTWNDLMFSMRSFLYMWTPSETQFRTVEEVPNGFVRLVRYAPLVAVLECIGLYAQGKKLPRWNHSLMSVCTAILLFLPGTVIGNIEFHWFSLLYDKYRLIDLSWTSPWVWLACLVAADLSAYMWHRAAHEVNFIWAFHSVHHTPDEVNLLTAYRLSTFNRQIAIFFYLPMAVIFPPGIFYVHYQLNYMFQLWVHTKTFEGSPALGKIIITPSLHRVHHARNRYCIDKNYGAVLSIWDQMFGTYTPYRPEIKLSYGLVSRLQSFDPVAVQFKYMKEIVQRARTYDIWRDRISTFLMGPGWSPGKPRLGVYEEIAKEYTDKPYDKISPNWCYAYVTWIMLTSLMVLNALPYVKMMYGTATGAVVAAYVFWTIANSGYFLEQKPWVPASEIVRCLAYFYVETILLPAVGAQSQIFPVLRVSSMLSILTWSFKLNMFVNDTKDV